MAYKLTLPAEMEPLLADAMWWKFNPTAPDEPTVEQKQDHAGARVKEFLFAIIREYRLHMEIEAAVSKVRDQINADLAQARAAVVIEQVTE